MESFNINKEELLFFSMELEASITDLFAIFNRYGLEHSSINELQGFAESLPRSMQFNELEYFNISRKICLDLVQLVSENDVCRTLVNLSRVNSSISEILLQLNLRDRIALFLIETNYEWNDYNSVFLQDCIYSYYYYKLKRILDEEGYLALKIKLEQQLQSNPIGKSKKFIIQTVLKSFQNIKKLSDEENQHLSLLLT